MLVKYGVVETEDNSEAAIRVVHLEAKAHQEEKKVRRPKAACGREAGDLRIAYRQHFPRIVQPEYA